MIHFKSRKALTQFFFPLRFSLHGASGVENRNMGQSWGQKHGFTLIEVMLSMMIASLIITPIFILHSMIMDRVTRSSRAYDYIVMCKNLLYEARQKQEHEAQNFSLEKKEIDFDVTLTYSLEKGIDQKSSLASLKGLHQEIVNISWTEQGQKKQERLVTFVYKKPEQKKS